MGQITLAWFGALAALGAAALIFGIATRRLLFITLGASMLVSLAASWVLGPYGFGLGLLVLGGGWFGRGRKP